MLEWEQSTGTIFASGDARIIRIWDTQKEIKSQVCFNSDCVILHVTWQTFPQLWLKAVKVKVSMNLHVASRPTIPASHTLRHNSCLCVSA